MAEKSVSVHVPQKDGVITVFRGGFQPIEVEVKDHTCQVDATDLKVFLRSVDGAQESSKK